MHHACAGIARFRGNQAGRQCASGCRHRPGKRRAARLGNEAIQPPRDARLGTQRVSAAPPGNRLGQNTTAL
eukprot:4666251-Prymnesium_polylepis.2